LKQPPKEKYHYPHFGFEIDEPHILQGNALDSAWDKVSESNRIIKNNANLPVLAIEHIAWNRGNSSARGSTRFLLQKFKFVFPPNSTPQFLFVETCLFKCFRQIKTPYNCCAASFMNHLKFAMF
jgi:hypothetical protein